MTYLTLTQPAAAPDQDTTQQAQASNAFASHFMRYADNYANKAARFAAHNRIEEKRQATSKANIKADLVKAYDHAVQIAGASNAIRTLASAGIVASMSKDALEGNFKKFLGKSGNVDDTFGLYEQSYPFFEQLLTAHLPYVLTYDEFMTVCGNCVIDIEITATCPVCGSCDMKTIGILDVVAHHGHYIGFECQSCNFCPMADIPTQVKPEREHESLTRSYIRSLLTFEGYNKNHGLGPIYERRTLVSVAEQAAKALVHLPDGLSIDYQQLVKEEMSR